MIDKDLASAVLAKEITADMLMISTAVEQVCRNFGKPDQKSLDRLTVAEAKRYATDGHFKPGSMVPKIQACIQFIVNGRAEAFIPPKFSRPRLMAGRVHASCGYL